MTRMSTAKSDSWTKVYRTMQKNGTVVRTVISEEGDSFHQILERFDPVISHDHLEIYCHWLLTNSAEASGMSEVTLPVGRGEYLSGEIHFPRPTGHYWRYMLEQWELDQGGGDPIPLIRRSMHTTPRGNL